MSKFYSVSSHRSPDLRKSRKFLLVESQNPEKFLLEESGIQEIFACGIRNPGNFWLLKFGIPAKLSYGIKNLGL